MGLPTAFAPIHSQFEAKASTCRSNPYIYNINKNTAYQKIDCVYCEGTIKKIFYPFNRWIWTQITPKGVYIIDAEHRISSTRSAVYHHCERGYSLRLMRYTLKRDDIPLLSQWIKNSTSRNLSNFWCTRRDLNSQRSRRRALFYPIRLRVHIRYYIAISKLNQIFL